MALTLTLDSYAAACGCNRGTASRRLRRTPRTGLRRQRFALVDILPRLLPRHRQFAPALTKAARDDHEPSADLTAATALESFILADPEMSARLYSCRVEFFRALGRRRVSSTDFYGCAYWHTILVLAPPVLRFTVLGDPKLLPRDWDGWCADFAITHNAPADAGLQMRVAA